MAQLRLTSKGLMILFIIMSFIAFGVGFATWELAGNKNLAPTESAAGGSAPGRGNCTTCPKWGGIEDGYCTKNATNLASCQKAKDKKDQQRENPPPAPVCGCQNYNNGCGVNCYFPAGTAAQVKAKAENACGSFIAMCNAGRTVTIEAFGPGHKCWGKTDECKNPTATATCTCDGGAVTAPVNSADYNVGDVVEVKGYAFDTDGINKAKVVVKVDGTVVGNATATDHACANAGQDAICTAAAGKAAVDWTYSYTVTKAGAHTFNVTWEDTKGLTSAQCGGERAITANVQGNPSWEINKTGATVCIDETEGAQVARVDYTVSIKNVGDLAGQLTKLVDVLDSKVKSSFIKTGTITPDATVSGKTLTWDLDGSKGAFAVNQTKTYKYSIEVPEASFGTYTNTATATPDSGDVFKAIEVSVASCNAPETGLLDSAISKVVLGVLLVGVSAAYLYSDSFGLNFLGKKKDRRKEFENRVAGK